MKKIVLLVTALSALVAPGAADAGLCGLPDSRPLYIEFSDASVKFRNDLFRRPGLVLATNSVAPAAYLREGGAHTVYWWMKLEKVVGEPEDPYLPEVALAAADRLFDFAVASTGCATPYIALNELWGTTLPTPWTEFNVRYRENVLAVLRRLHERGARPALLVPSNPNTAGDAALWWGAVAQVADIVRQVYVPAPAIHALGPIEGSRTLRTRMRDAVRGVGATGLPPQRIGIMLGFHSGGRYGRARLQPRSAWLRFVKLNALAARHVAQELGVGTVWSWGWGTFDMPGSADPDKPLAACVYLWARDPALCDAPAVASFNTSLTEGQPSALPPGVQCTLRGGQITFKAVADLARVLGGDRKAAASALFWRIAERAHYRVPWLDVAEAERALIAHRFNGDTDAFFGELGRVGVSRSLAQAMLIEELRRQVLSQARDRRLARYHGALRHTICVNDELPEPLDVRLTTYVPFLQLP